MASPPRPAPRSRSTPARLLRFVIPALLAAGLGVPPRAAAGEAPVDRLEALADGGRARAVEVIDGDTLVLSDGHEVRLVGIQAPKLPLGRRGFVAWPLADEAKAALERLTLGKNLRLGFGGRRRDRHGRTLAHLIREDDGTWIQGAMLEAGLARVYTFEDNRSVAGLLLEREEAARAAKRGIWSDPFYAILEPEDTPRHIGDFVLVEGRVEAAATVRGRAYLNFGSDWRDDFTVTVAPRDRRTFFPPGWDPEAYESRRIRVRGWLESYNGPSIDATHPEQIEVLD